MDAAQTLKTVRRSMIRPGSVGKFDELLSRSSRRTVARHSVEVHDDPNGNPDWSASRQEAPYRKTPDAAYWEEQRGSVADEDGYNRLDGESEYQAQVRRTMESVDETITKDTSAGEVIHDFVHSKNKTFKGHSKKLRIKQALAAHYAKQRESVNETEDDSHEALIAHKKISSSKKTPFTGSRARSHEKHSTHVHSLALKALEKQKKVVKESVEHPTPGEKK